VIGAKRRDKSKEDVDVVKDIELSSLEMGIENLLRDIQSNLLDKVINFLRLSLFR
jgi:hypothetical protein